MPIVSIVTPAYNAAAYLAAAIQSAQQQTFGDFELLIVDDGSTDDTARLAQQFAARDRRIRLIRQANAGSAAARNTAIQAAVAPFLALLDSDDLWMPAFLESQLAILDERPDIDIVSANAFNLGGPLDGTPLKPVSSGVKTVSLLDLIEVEDSLCIMSVFRARVIERTGGFYVGALNGEDYDLWLRAALAGCGIVFNATPAGFYRRRPESKSASEQRMLAGNLAIMSRLREACLDRAEALGAIERQRARLERRLLIAEAKAALLERDFGRARTVFARMADGAASRRERAIATLGKTMPELLRMGYLARSKCRTVLRGRRSRLARA
jgi:glycosyltransferase involved in cell wall biosynthesis